MMRYHFRKTVEKTEPKSVARIVLRNLFRLSTCSPGVSSTHQPCYSCSRGGDLHCMIRECRCSKSTVMVPREWSASHRMPYARTGTLTLAQSKSSRFKAIYPFVMSVAWLADQTTYLIPSAHSVEQTDNRRLLQWYCWHDGRVEERNRICSAAGSWDGC